MALVPGTRIGPSAVVSSEQVGWAVYRATDTRLERDVAAKILLPEIARFPDGLARFSREAQLLASLNHPNIAQVHGVEEAAGAPALVKESRTNRADRRSTCGHSRR